MTKLEDGFSLHFWDGIKSGFPLCCILFFCNVWIPLRESKRMFSYGEHKEYSTGVGYVQCPQCIMENLR